MPSLATQLTHFYRSLRPPRGLPPGIGVLYPQKDPEVMGITAAFFDKFFADSRPRHLLLGINPGRFGAGVTGINFTAPRQLAEHCGLAHPFKAHSELSAEFIYEVIDAYGGCVSFYGDFFLSAVSPLGYIRDGRNLNYYDDPALLRAVTPFIVRSLRRQLDFGFRRDHCLCIGGEKNFRFLQQINEQYGWFDRITPLAHPRFIMQYRRRRKGQFVRQYVDALREAAGTRRHR